MTEVAPGLSLVVADCLDALRELAAESVDAVVTDPPYGISFMGKAWDRPTIAHEVERRRALEREADGGDFGNAAQSAGIYDVSAKGNRAFQVWTETWALEAYRVLKPGGHLLSFASTRTYHRMASGVEDAGFEIRDTLAWMFGSGFPKSRTCRKRSTRPSALREHGGRRITQVGLAHVRRPATSSVSPTIATMRTQRACVTSTRPHLTRRGNGQAGGRR